MGGTGGAGGMGGAGGSGPVAVCGNGKIEVGEHCDDGNMDDGDGCSNACKLVPSDQCPTTGVLIGPSEMPMTLQGDMSGKASDIDSSCGPDKGDVIFAVTPTVGGTLTATLKAGVNKSVAIQSACATTLPREVVELACVDTDKNSDATQAIWVHAGVTYYVIADVDGTSYTLDLQLTACNDGVVNGLEQCDDKNDTSCVGCLKCADTGQFWDPATNHCYQLVTGGGSTKSWSEARADCVTRGGDLVGIESKAEFEFIASQQQVSADTWIGGYAPNVCSYVWANGEQWRSQWEGGQPNGAPDACVELYRNLGQLAMYDRGCGTKMDYLCERVPAGKCGDGIVQPGEQCDGGNGCDAQCKRSFTCNGAGELENGGHCYRAVQGSAKSWNNAKADCEAWGGYLATIESQAENDLIKSHITADSWLGGWEGNYNNGTVIWEGSVTSCGYTKWANMQPNNLFDKCIEMTSGSGEWADRPCGEVHDYVCEREP